MRKKKLLAVIGICALLVFLAALAGCGEKKEPATSKKPKILAVAPESGPAGTQVEVVGERFGTTQGNAVIRVGTKVADVVAWTDNKVTAKVPAGVAAATQPVTMLTAEGQSNYVEFTVIAQQGQQPERKEGQIEQVTAAQAIIDFMKKQGTDPAGITFSIVQVSEKDPNWKVDAAYQPGKPTMYYLLHMENGNWVVKDDGTALSKTQLTAKGAPADLYSRPQAATQSDAVISYMKTQGTDPVGVSVVVTRVGKTDPAWELGLARKAGQPDAVVVFHKENDNWVVKGMGAGLTSAQIAALGAPKDLVHTPTEAQAIVAWIQAGNAPPGVTATGWALSVVKVSKIDSDWEIVQGTQQGNPQPMYFLLHWENGAWVVKDTGGALTAQELSAAGAPTDLP